MLRIVVVVAVVLMAGAALAERRVALVMGAERYETLRPLDNAVDDAVAMRDVLEGLGFEVFLETDRDLRRMRRALEDFAKDARGADVAIIYFAGHGVETGGHNLLLPVDADGSSAEALSNTALPLEDLRDTALSVADTVLIVLDACREDPFLSPASAGGGRSAQRLDAPDLPQGVTAGLGRMGRSENVLYAFAAAPGETASDGEGGHSPFTAALVKYLGMDGLEIRSVLTLVQQEVYDATRGRQLPYVESGLPRVFFASTVHEALPERERLLLAMADVTPADRDLVETIAGDYDMPLAPLYAAVIGEKTDGTNLAERLREAAADYVSVRDELSRLASSDPRVTQLRADAERELARGVFERARDLLSEAAVIDAASRSELKANYVERTLSEAATRFVSGGAARAELRYDLAVTDLEKAVALFAEAGNDIPAGDFDRSLAALQTLGDTYVTVGNIAAAETAYAALEDHATTRVGSEPSYRHDLSIARSRLGSTRLALGDLPAALAAFRAAIEALDAAPDDMARNGEWRRSRAIVQDKLGAALMTAGDLDGALAAFGDSLAVKLELAESDPADTVALRDLTVTYDALGDLLRVTGRFDEAETAFRASLEARVQLLNARPDDPERARDLSVSYDNLGNMLRDRGSATEALDAYRSGKAIIETLLARDPSNTQLRRDLVVSDGKIGNALRDMGKADGALAAYRGSLEGIRMLADLDPNNRDWQRDLSIALEKVADLLRSGDDLAGALQNYEQSLGIMRRLAGSDPSNSDWQRDLSITLAEIGNIRLALRRAAEASAALSECLAIREKLAARQPSNTLWQRDLVIALVDFAPVASDPRAQLLRARKIVEQLVAQGRLPGRDRDMIRQIDLRLAVLGSR